jgi:hypothetical protein
MSWLNVCIKKPLRIPSGASSPQIVPWYFEFVLFKSVYVDCWCLVDKRATSDKRREIKSSCLNEDAVRLRSNRRRLLWEELDLWIRVILMMARIILKSCQCLWLDSELKLDNCWVENWFVRSGRASRVIRPLSSDCGWAQQVEAWCKSSRLKQTFTARPSAISAVNHW